MGKTNRYLLLMLLLTCFYLKVSPPIFAAPDPVEVEKLKKNAPIQLIGTVVKDELRQDLTTEKELYHQLRTMTISVKEWIRVPSDDRKNKSIDVIYSYIPSWQADLYVGGSRMDITVGDVVEIWLRQGDYGWEPVLGGNTVNHIVYVDDREEPIPEPFPHKLKRSLYQIWESNTSLVVLVSLIVFVSVLMITFRKKSNTSN